MISQRRNQWRSFAGGELSEEMYGRSDLPRHAIGLKECYNTIVTPQGALENRAGSRFISPTQNNAPAWLIPFVRSDGQGFLLEFGDAYVRVLGGGNIINEEPDPGDTFTVSAVDIWTPADGYPITPVQFTTSAPHGFAVGDAVRFQGFTLVNPDQAGVNQMAAFMNATWYVYKVVSATVFQVISYTPFISPVANMGFEQGDTGWTDSGQGSFTIDTDSPVQAGSFSAKLGFTSNPNAGTLFVRSDTRFAVIEGQSVTVDAQIYGQDGGDDALFRLDIRWENTTGQLISTTEGTLYGTADALEAWTAIQTVGTAPAGATHFKVQLTAAWGDSNWSVDAIELDYDAALWYEFSNAPYNGLVNGGTVSLAANTAPIVLAPTYSQSHIRFASYAQFVDDLVITHNLYPVAKVSRVSDNEWSFTALTFNSALAAPAGITAAPIGTPGADVITYTYTVTSTNDAGAESAIGTPDGADNTLRTVGNFNSITWSSVATTFRYNIYKDVGGQVYGYIGSSTGLEFTDDNIAPDYLKQPPAVLADFNAAGEYPSTVAFHEQRMALAGSLDEPQAFWVSGLAAFDYFKASVPPQDDQAFTYELTSTKAAPILHSTALNELLFFTTAGVHRVITIEGELFGPTTVAARPVIGYGAHELAKPQEAGTSILYPVERGGHLYEMTPADGLAGYTVADLSIVAAHLIDNYDWVQTAFRRAPFPIWFGLRDDGKLVGLTYMPEQKLVAWHQHELPGAFIESIAVVPEGSVDALYVIARRTIAGSETRYIERIEPRNYGTTQADAYFVDSGVTYRGAETNVVSGLDHLEGEDVMVLGDGRVSGPYEVVDGAITLDGTASVIHVGLSYTSRVETLPLAYQEFGFGVGIMKNVSNIWLRVKQALGITAGVTFDDDDQYPLPDAADEELGSVPTLRDGVHDITPLGVWTVDSTICIEQTQPLPFTLTSMSTDYVDG